MGVFAMLLSRSGHSFALAAINLTLVGFFGGLFAVPLNALLQQRSGEPGKGPPDGDQQLPEHGRRSWSRPACSSLLQRRRSG